MNEKTMRGESQRVNLRFTPDEFELLNKKRFESRTTLQSAGKGLMLEWARGERPVPEQPPHCAFADVDDDEKRILRGVLAYLRLGADSPGYRAWVRALRELGQRNGD